MIVWGPLVAGTTAFTVPEVLLVELPPSICTETDTGLFAYGVYGAVTEHVTAVAGSAEAHDPFAYGVGQEIVAAGGGEVDTINCVGVDRTELREPSLAIAVT